MTNTKKSLVAAGILTALIAGNVATAAVVPAGVQLAEKQTLVRNNGSEVQSLDPHKIEGVPESNISRDLFEGLIISDVDGKPSPGVAEKWENKDFKVWTFHLRKDAKWSDGSPVTAHDFVYSWQRLANPNTASPYASYLQYGHIVNIDDIVAGKNRQPILVLKPLMIIPLKLPSASLFLISTNCWCTHLFPRFLKRRSKNTVRSGLSQPILLPTARIS